MKPAWTLHLKNRDWPAIKPELGDVILGESLNDRRAANAQIKNTEPGFRDDFFFLHQANRFKYGLGLMRTDHGRGAVRHYAYGAGNRFCLVRMVVGRLRHRRP